MTSKVLQTILNNSKAARIILHQPRPPLLGAFLDVYLVIGPETGSDPLWG